MSERVSKSKRMREREREREKRDKERATKREIVYEIG